MPDDVVTWMGWVLAAAIYALAAGWWWVALEDLRHRMVRNAMAAGTAALFCGGFATVTLALALK